MQARVTYDPACGILMGVVFESRATFEARDPREMAEWLFAAGVRSGDVTMPDWREGDMAPATSDKIALNFRLNQLGLTAERLAALRTVPVMERNGRAFYVRLADIPAPWREAFRATLYGSGCPAIEGEAECAYAWDWEDWLQGRFPRW